MRRFVFVLALLSAACASVVPRSDAPPTLASLTEEYWQRQLEQNVSTRADLGLPIERLPDVSFAQAEREAAFARDFLARLERVDETRLTDDERITLALLRHLQRETIDGLPHFWLQFPVTPYASPIRGVNLVLARLPVTTSEEKARYLRLLDDHVRFIDSITDIVREQRSRGILVPQPELPLVRSLLTTAALAVHEARSTDPDFVAQVRDTIATKNEPAMARLAELFSPDYEKAAPAKVGLGQHPGGDAAYRFLVRSHTTLDLSPEEIHALGLREVARIRGEMDAVRNALGFEGTREEFQQQARFFAQSPEEIGERLMSHVARIKPQVHRFFATTPRAPYGVTRLAEALEPVMTFGYYQQPTSSDATGRYLYNGSKLTERNLMFAAALMAHELVPGHHFQIARQLEAESIPPFRRKRYDTAFVEGWGEYAAMLAGEMGLYEDPYDRYGRLTMDMLLSTRLVVDTGMNALGWTREQAMEFMRANTLLSETEIATESLRYSVDIPAQALAYKMGSLRMMELRRRAERDLGPRFRITEFHEWVLAHGSMPLGILEEHVTRQIAKASRESEHPAE